MAENNKVNESKSESKSGGAASNPWTKAWIDPLERIEAIYDQVAKMQAASVEQARKNVDEAARLTKESIAYTEQLTAQWRALSFDAARRMAEMFAAAKG
jgi:hypothetical protein